jgi:hypothetical protein
MPMTAGYLSLNVGMCNVQIAQNAAPIVLMEMFLNFRPEHHAHYAEKL